MHKKKPLDFQRLFGCTPAGGRTLDTLIKSQVLYQLSYGSIVCDCKSTTFFDYGNSFFGFFYLLLVIYLISMTYLGNKLLAILGNRDEIDAFRAWSHVDNGLMSL